MKDEKVWCSNSLYFFHCSIDTTKKYADSVEFLINFKFPADENLFELKSARLTCN